MKVSSTAERIKLLLKEFKMTQTALAKLLHVHRSTVAQYVSGAIIPRQDKIYQMAQIFHVDPAYLMGFNVDRDGNQISTIIDPRKANKHLDNLNKAVGLALRQIRVEKKVTLEKMAEMLGREIEVLESFENNKEQITVIAVSRYCHVLNYDIFNFMNLVQFIFNELEKK